MVVLFPVQTLQNPFPRTILSDHFLMMCPNLGLYSFWKSFYQCLYDIFGMLAMFEHIKVYKGLFNGPPSNEFFTAYLPNADICFRKDLEVSLNKILLWPDSCFKAFIDELVLNALVGTEVEIGWWCVWHLLSIWLLICIFSRKMHDH